MGNESLVKRLMIFLRDLQKNATNTAGGRKPPDDTDLTPVRDPAGSPLPGGSAPRAGYGHGSLPRGRQRTATAAAEGSGRRMRSGGTGQGPRSMVSPDVCYNCGEKGRRSYYSSDH